MTNKQIKTNQADQNPRADGELSDSELDAVSGGFMIFLIRANEAARQKAVNDVKEFLADGLKSIPKDGFGHL